MSFSEILADYDWLSLEREIRSVSDSDVQSVLRSSTARTLDDLKVLLSPAAANHLEEMAARSRELTLKRFGRTIQLFVPIYLSNECQNICTYCGFSYHNKIERLTLNENQVRAEIEAVKALGYEHVLLVTGEAPKTVGVDYLEKIIRLVRPLVSQVSLEVQPLEEDEYIRLMGHGLHSVLVYQETYDRAHYRAFHPKGKKSNFSYRLETPDRLGRAGIHKIGLGVLLGLSQWRVDTFCLGLHLNYLERNYWKTKYSISFPRLRPAEGMIEVPNPVSERELLQIICAFRIFSPDVELSLSTRESEKFRDNVMSLGITSMSAGSRTDPGGYALKAKSLEQFSISDERSPEDVAHMIRRQGYDPVWKDWDVAFG